MAILESGRIVEYLTFSNIVTCFTAYLLISTIVNFIRAPKYPTSIPWVGHGKGWFSALKNVITAFSDCRTWMQTGYDKYSKDGKAFVMPGMLGAAAEVVIPPAQMSWLLDQPDSILSSAAAHYDSLHGEYSFGSPQIIKHPYHERVIHRNLARNLNSVVKGLNDEVNHALDNLLGSDTENFVEMDILEGFMMKIIPVLNNRMLVGEPLCRNEDFLNTMLAFTMDVIRGFLLFAVVPTVLHTIVGPIHAISPKYHYWRSRKYTLPLIQKRLEDIKKKDAGDPEYKSWTEPNDFITWIIRTALSDGRQDELEPGRIAMRILPLNFASIHTTAMTGQGVLLDVLSSDPSVIDALREEAERIYNEEGRHWTKAGLSRMYRMDSAIRESQRNSPIAVSFVAKKVVAKEGITTPEGVHLEYGTILGSPWLPAAFDPEAYDKPEVYDAFRYSREREDYEAMDAVEKGNVDTLKLKQRGLVTTGTYHLPFGHGRNACPGRFFVAQELKMLFGHLLLHYDIEPLPERPRAKWIGRQMIPPKALLRVKRRKVGT